MDVSLAIGNPAATARSCGCCGAPARVVILIGYREGAPAFATFCLDCAPDGDVAAPRHRRTHIAAWALLVAGLMLALAAAFADSLADARQPGFGVFQRAAVAVGALCLVVGGVIRAALLIVSGSLLIAMFAAFDFVFVEAQPGFGVKQQAGALLGVVLALAGIIRRLASIRRAPAAAAPCIEP